MPGSLESSKDRTGYVLSSADDSCEWYHRAAISSRRAHRASTVAVQSIAAAIPVAAVIEPHNVQ
jgi:hypothetical protein